ncbi:MAG: helix-turn-helix domain-containing protein [Verrucomicrobiota bacterium]
MSTSKNIHHGGDFTKFLRDEGIYEEVEAAAIKKVISAALAKQMERRGVTVSELAEKLGTSRAALNRVLDEDNTSITLTTLSRTAAALGCRVNLEIVATR